MRYFFIIFTFVCVGVVSILGFRGMKFTNEPLYIFPDMDWQAKYQPQGENNFFSDGRNDRPVVPATVARGNDLGLKEIFSAEYEYAPAKNPGLFSGKAENGEWLTEFPIEINHELMEVGQAKFNIFCYTCHGYSGDGNGITKSYGMVATPSYHDDRIREMAVGEIYNTATHGKGQMNGYGAKLRPEERWAIVAYVRALQLSQNAKLQDVPQEFRSELEL